MEIYRDPTEGVLARRRELVRERREELALLPHVVRRVVVARRARIAASIVAIAGGVLFAAAACSGAVAAALSRVMPGPEPAPLTTLLVVGWTVTIVAYFASRAMHEHRFAVAMSRTILPSADLAHDVERFSHEGPERVAHTMARRLETRSIVLPTLAAALLVPPLAVYAVLAFAARGWPENAKFEELARTHHAFFAGLGLAVAVCMASALASHLRGERDRIATDDPTAGGDFFTWRVFFARTKTRIVAICARITRRQLAYASGLWGLAALSLFVWHREAAVAPPPPAATYASAALPAPTPAPPSAAAPSPHEGTLYRGRDGSLVVSLDHPAVDFATLDGFDWVPAGWHARIEISAQGSDVVATPFLGRQPQRIADGSAAKFEVCQDTPQRLGLHVDARAHPATLRISVTLDTNCQLK